MTKKLKVEAYTYNFVRKAVLWLVLGAVVSGGYYRYFVENCLYGGRGELFFNMLIPSVNWCVVQQDMIHLIRWTPWRNIVYTLGSQALSGLYILKETGLPGYRFYWQYWLAVLAVSLVLAVLLERNRDYVFEQNRRSG